MVRYTLLISSKHISIISLSLRLAPAPFIASLVLVIKPSNPETKLTRKPKRQKPSNPETKLTRKPSSVEFNARWVIYICRIEVPLCGKSSVFWFPGCLDSGVLGSFVVLICSV